MHDIVDKLSLINLEMKNLEAKNMIINLNLRMEIPVQYVQNGIFILFKDKRWCWSSFVKK